MDKENKYNPLKDYLNNMEVFPDEGEIEDIVSLALKQDSYEANKGYRFKRTEHNPTEMAFYEQWLKENEPLSYVNYGHGILQDLFFEQSDSPIRRDKCIETITNRDRWIVATVIQWLGTNVGMCFLNEALVRVNLRIMPKDSKTNEL